MSEKDKKNRKMKNILLIVFIAFIAAVILCTAIHEFSSKPPEKLGFTFEPRNYLMILLGFLCAAAALFIETAKYLLMMRAINVRVSFKTAFETAALGKYYDNITPSGVGGQPFQIYNLHKAGYSGGASMAMPLTGFFTMQAGFVLLAVLVFIFKGNAVENAGIRAAAYVGAVMYMLLPAAIVIFTISEAAGEKLVRVVVGLGARLRIIKEPEKLINRLTDTFRNHRESVALISGRKGVLPLLFFLSFVYQTAVSSIPYFIIKAYNGDVSYLNILAMTVIAYCAITIIPTPGNSGAAEGAFYIIFSALDPTGLFWSMLIWRVACYYFYIAVGLAIYAYRAARSGKRIRDERQEYERQ